MKKHLTALRAWATAHKVASSAIVLVVIIGGIGMYESAATAQAQTQYVLSPVTMGNIVQTVTGSGQVSASNQLDVTPQASGEITSINVSVGQHVNTGDLLATIDDTDAANSLTSAQIALAKLTEAPKPTDINNAQNSVSQSYTTAFNGVSSLYLDMQTVVPGLNTLFNTQGSFLSDQAETQLTPQAQIDRDQASSDFDKVYSQYQSLLPEYAALSRQSSTSTIEADLQDAESLAKNTANALSETQNTVTYINSNESNYQPKDAATALTNVTSWSSTINGDVANLLSSDNGISSAENALTVLVDGADPLDVQSQQLSVDQAQQSYDDDFVRAPFSGVIGRIPANVYSQASGSTIIATVVGDQKMADISLDEVDAAKVKVGQPVSITFDAISNFTASGTVSEVDQVGTVTSGVVSFGIKITINTQDARILPGLSLNVTITTNELDGVLVVPSAAVKTQGTQSYVQVFSSAAVRAYMQSMATASGKTASSTRSGTGTGGGRGAGSFASSTRSFTGTGSGTGGTGSTTRAFVGTGASGGRSLSVTMPSATVPANQVVSVGQSDSTNTQIVNGLTAGEWVVTRVITGSAAKATTAAPSLLSSLGAGGRTAGGAAAGGLGGGAAGGGFRGGAAGGGAAAAR